MRAALLFCLLPAFGCSDLGTSELPGGTTPDDASENELDTGSSGASKALCARYLGGLLVDRSFWVDVRELDADGAAVDSFVFRRRCVGECREMVTALVDCKGRELDLASPCCSDELEALLDCDDRNPCSSD